MSISNAIQIPLSNKRKNIPKYKCLFIHYIPDKKMGHTRVSKIFISQEINFEQNEVGLTKYTPDNPTFFYRVSECTVKLKNNVMFIGINLAIRMLVA